MADVKVEKKGSEESKGLERQNRGWRSELFPGFWSSPTSMFTMNPFSLMRRFSEEMDRAFSSGWSRPMSMWDERVGWSPTMEVIERDGNLIVHADLPGINQNDVKVEVTDDGLVIQGERKSEYEKETGSGYHSERSYGKFYRSIPLPADAKVEQARAEFKNGVLEVSIPVPDGQRRRRQIPVTTSGERKPAGAEMSSQKQEGKAAAG